MHLPRQHSSWLSLLSIYTHSCTNTEMEYLSGKQNMVVPGCERHDWKLCVYFTKNESWRLHLEMVILVHSPLVHRGLLLVQQLWLQQKGNNKKERHNLNGIYGRFSHNDPLRQSFAVGLKSAPRKQRHKTPRRMYSTLQYNVVYQQTPKTSDAQRTRAGCQTRAE